MCNQKQPDPRDVELEAPRPALKATILNVERLVEEGERVLRRAKETFDALQNEYANDE